MIVAHFFWEVIVSDLAHEKSELAQLCIVHKNRNCLKKYVRALHFITYS